MTCYYNMMLDGERCSGPDLDMASLRYSSSRTWEQKKCFLPIITGGTLELTVDRPLQIFRLYVDRGRDMQMIVCWCYAWLYEKENARRLGSSHQYHLNFRIGTPSELNWLIYILAIDRWIQFSRFSFFPCLSKCIGTIPTSGCQPSWCRYE